MIPFPDKKYSVIYADPPWQYDDKADSGKRGAGHKYSTMSIYDIMALPVRQIAAKDSLLFLWSTGPMIEEAKHVMKAWGFTYRTVAFVWVKTNKNLGKKLFDLTEMYNCRDEFTAEMVVQQFLEQAVFKGMGNYTRSNVEYVYLGSRGKNPERFDKSISQVVFAPRGRHSEKPDEVRNKIDRMYGDVSKIELFARRTNAPGWDFWGDEVTDVLPLSENV